MSISLLEQETIILFNRAEGEAEVFTYEPTLKRRLDDMADTFAEVGHNLYAPEETYHGKKTKTQKRID